MPADIRADLAAWMRRHDLDDLEAAQALGLPDPLNSGRTQVRRWLRGERKMLWATETWVRMVMEDWETSKTLKQHPPYMSKT